MNILLLLLPSIGAWIMSALCPMSKFKYLKPKSTPPNWIFPVVWTILYLIMGFVLTRIVKSNDKVALTLFVIQLILNYLWVFFFSCKKNPKLALYDMLLLIIINLSLTIYLVKKDNLSSVLLTPYIGWLLFASMLNFKIVEN